MPMPQQQSLELKTWGGRRRGAGRRSARPRGAVPHTPREEIRPYQPVHVTLRVAEPVCRVIALRLDPEIIRRLDRYVERRQREEAFFTRSL